MSLNGPAPEHLRPIRPSDGPARPNDEGKKRGMDRVESRDPSWSDRALEVIRLLALTRGYGETLSNNDLTDILRDDQPEHPNMWGPVWRRAANKGYVRMTGMTVKSTMHDSNAHRIALWESCIEQAS